MPWGGSGAIGFGLLWSLVAVALLLVLLAGLVYLALRFREEESDVDALSVLRRRYAAGEIDDEEFERRRTRLDGGSTS
jgi:putative membrane protein